VVKKPASDKMKRLRNPKTISKPSDPKPITKQIDEILEKYKID
jgi:hypothetical protein